MYLFSAFQSLNLPAAIEDIGGGGKLPVSIQDKRNKVKAEGGIAFINSMMAELPELLTRNKQILDEVRHSFLQYPATTFK